MRIGIDARMYGPKQGGLGRYIEQLIKNLEKIDSANEYIIFLRKENFEEFQPANSNFKKVLADVYWYGLAEQTKIPKIIKQQKVDLMHFPHWNVPYFYNGPFMVTIHDLILFHYPTRRASTRSVIVYWLKHQAHKILIKKISKKAKKIITPSEFTKQDIHKTLKIPLQKIFVTLLSPQPQEQKQNNISHKELFKKFNINKPYALYVGVAYPHKNLEGLVDAWHDFEKKYGDNFQLILVGKKNYFYDRLINSKKFKQCKNIIFTDYLNDDELNTIYSGAMLYVFPSLYEGFGLPPLEAMTHHVPVISANSACLPEILGSAALYFDPKNPEEITQALYNGFTNQNLRLNLIQQSQQILKKYSWLETAKRTLQIYKTY
ncbi:MAG: glycosyltransferase family 1 protein [Patescibacteria group bacterium]